MKIPRAVYLLAALAAPACGAPDHHGANPGLSRLEGSIRRAVQATGAEVGVYYRSLDAEGDSLALDADVRMHAASTMKVPVMMQLYLDAQGGGRSMDDSVRVTTTFVSIVDGSPFDLPPGSDSDTTFYGRVGDRVPIRQLLDRMITWSSNLATNILIQEADPRRITRTLRALGADSMEVLRGVEDLKAFEAGLSNSATARDLGIVMAAVAGSPRFSTDAREEMLSILERQHFRENIPAGVPGSVRVANKTGWITAHNHDAAVVFPLEAPPYVLAVMVRGVEEQSEAAELVAEISRQVYAFHMGRARPR
ncbi:MAG TPA: serine hydrolase [Longimicrobiales bacterium]|nr:serine hydrolase [Longimicrobiales bacterium]